MLRAMTEGGVCVDLEVPGLWPKVLVEIREIIAMISQSKNYRIIA